MRKLKKNHAPNTKYVSVKQLTIEGFETPFKRNLNSDNRWVRLAKLLPWEELIEIYRKHVPEKSTGRPGLNPRVVLGAIIIKHMCDLDDREVVDQISENVYMQYFLGYYPSQVLADKIYCTRENRAYLKKLDIMLKAKPLGRPAKEAMSNHVSPGERNPIEAKFGQAKTGYGLNRVKARLAKTSESWVASIILVLNLVHLAEVALYWIQVIYQYFKESLMKIKSNDTFISNHLCRYKYAA